MNQKIFIKTFGCQMNEYDSNKIYAAVKKIGYEKTDRYENANCYLLNTCQIRDNAKEKVLQFIIDKYPDIDIQYTKHGNPKPGTLDMCDSIVIALAGDKLVREAQTT